MLRSQRFEVNFPQLPLGAEMMPLLNRGVILISVVRFDLRPHAELSFDIIFWCLDLNGDCQHLATLFIAVEIKRVVVLLLFHGLSDPLSHHTLDYLYLLFWRFR